MTNTFGTVLMDLLIATKKEDDELRKALAYNDKLWKALEFYANYDNYDNDGIVMCEVLVEGVDCLQCDRGQIARDALEGEKCSE